MVDLGDDAKEVAAGPARDIACMSDEEEYLLLLGLGGK